MVDFLKYRLLCALFSIAIFSTFFGILIYKKVNTGQVFSYSVEFTGGTQVLLEFDKPVHSSTIIDILEKHGWPGAITREFSETEVLVRIKEFSNNVGGLGEKIRTTLQQELDGIQVNLLQTDSIGQGIGETLSWNSAKAVLLGLILMLIYIGWRFWSLSYAVGAVVALFHDAIAILLFFLLFNKEVSANLISAILAVLGYSINDTIVIFTRIRENIKSMKNVPLTHIINVSLNQTLRRTILTSVSTALIVLSLIVLGGEALRDLSLALLIGIIFGTYSSIYIASPIMLLLYKKRTIS